MKIWSAIFLCILMVAVTGCGSPIGNNKVDDVAKVTLTGPCVGPKCPQSYTLLPDNKRDKAVIQKLVTWLNAAKEAGDSKMTLRSKGGSPRTLQINLKNGDPLTIQDAMSTACHPVSNGRECSNTPIKDQVTVDISKAGDNKTSAGNMVAPELKAWIDTNWKQDLAKK